MSSGRRIGGRRVACVRLQEGARSGCSSPGLPTPAQREKLRIEVVWKQYLASTPGSRLAASLLAEYRELLGQQTEPAVFDQEGDDGDE